MCESTWHSAGPQVLFCCSQSTCVLSCSHTGCSFFSVAAVVLNFLVAAASIWALLHQAATVPCFLEKFMLLCIFPAFRTLHTRRWHLDIEIKYKLAWWMGEKAAIHWFTSFGNWASPPTHFFHSRKLPVCPSSLPPLPCLHCPASAPATPPPPPLLAFLHSCCCGLLGCSWRPLLPGYGWAQWHCASAGWMALSLLIFKRCGGTDFA